MHEFNENSVMQGVGGAIKIGKVAIMEFRRELGL